jgi:hypothetical protein
LQQRLPGVSVVEAFNTMVAVRHASHIEGDAPLDAFVAGDDAEAKGKVGELAASLGYRVDAGAADGPCLGGDAFLNITLNAANGGPWQMRLQARSDEQQLTPAGWLGAVLEDGPFMGLSSAVRAAVEMAFDLGPVPDHLAAAVLADRGHPVDSALKAVEGVRCAGGNNIEALVIVVPTDLASRHGSILALSNKPFAVGVRHLVAGATACRSLQATAGRARREPDHETSR